MATEAQVLANRLNAQKSTGPRTLEGKAVVSQNAVKHGLSGRLDVIRGEDQAQFDLHREALLGELAPVGPVESMLAERVVSLSWRLQRVERMQNEVFDALLADRNSPLAKLVRSLEPKGAGQPEGGPEGEDDLALGRVVLKDFSNSRVLDRLLMYERRIEHSLFKTTAELQRLRLLRELDGPAEEPVGSEPGWGERGFPNAKNRVWGPRPRSSEEVGRGRPTYEETPDGVTTNAPTPEEPSCKTNPIPPAPSEDQVPCGTGVMTPDADCAAGKTKPISRAEMACPAGAGVAEPESAWRS